MITITRTARALKAQFEAIRARGGHAAIDFRDGEIALRCTQPTSDPETWGRGAVPQTYNDDWVRLVEC